MNVNYVDTKEIQNEMWNTNKVKQNEPLFRGSTSNAVRFL